MSLQNLVDRIANFLLTNSTENPTKFSDLEENLSLYKLLLKNNVVLQRFIQKTKAKNISIPETLFNTYQEDYKRIKDSITMVNILTKLCIEYDIPFVMNKTFQHYPDMGHDIDLLVLDPTFLIDKLIKEKFEFQYRPTSFSSRIASKRGYLLSGFQSPIELHHGRLGHIGEYHNYVKQVINRKIPITLSKCSTFIPSKEDQLIIQCIQRVYGHSTIRISDVIHTVKLIDVSSLNWEYIWSTVSNIGIHAGFTHYMTIVNNLHQKWDSKVTFPVSYTNKTAINNFQKLYFRRVCYKSTSLPKLTLLYLKKVLHGIYMGEWNSISRLCFLPFVIIFNVIRNLVRKFFQVS